MLVKKVAKNQQLFRHHRFPRLPKAPLGVRSRLVVMHKKEEKNKCNRLIFDCSEAVTKIAEKGNFCAPKPRCCLREKEKSNKKLKVEGPPPQKKNLLLNSW